MHIPGLPRPDRLWTSFDRDDVELLATDAKTAWRSGAQLRLVVRLWRSETLIVRLSTSQILLKPAIVQWHRDGAHALPATDVSASLSPSRAFLVRIADPAAPDAALRHLMAALHEALGPAARRRTDALVALARWRLFEAGLSKATLHIDSGDRPRLYADHDRCIPLAGSPHAADVLKTLCNRSDRIPCVLADAPASPGIPFKPLSGHPVARPEPQTAHARLALHDAARQAVAAAGIPPGHLGL
jgi:hypothetical protein